MTDPTTPVPVVIDTSVLLPTLHPLTPLQRPLTNLWRENLIKPVVTPDTLHELDIQLLKNKPPAGFLRRIYERYCHRIDEPIPPAEPKCRDETDQIFIDLATHYPAAYLIARDDDLLVLNGQASCPIINDTQFIELFTNRRSSTT